MKRITDWEIIEHDVQHGQYFRGCGVALTKFSDVATGVGDTPMDAYNDALEILARGNWNVDGLPTRPALALIDGTPSYECYWHVSVRVK